VRSDARNCQDLWIGVFQATSVPVDSVGSCAFAVGVMSVGRSSSLPLWNNLIQQRPTSTAVNGVG
jgi:hypothetical protein